MLVRSNSIADASQGAQSSRRRPYREIEARTAYHEIPDILDSSLLMRPPRLSTGILGIYRPRDEEPVAPSSGGNASVALQGAVGGLQSSSSSGRSISQNDKTATGYDAKYVVNGEDLYKNYFLEDRRRRVSVEDASPRPSSSGSIILHESGGTNTLGSSDIHPSIDDYLREPVEAPPPLLVTYNVSSSGVMDCLCEGPWCPHC